jgi:predicted kinase
VTTPPRVAPQGPDFLPSPPRPPPGLIVLAGLPGTGKSSVARALAERLGAVWLRVDTLEAAMLEAGLSRSFETGLAAYIGIREQARDHLRLGRWVVIDAVNGVREAREMWSDLCAALAVEKRVIELVCSDAGEHRRRVELRPQPTPPLPKPTWEQVQQREYLPWDEPHLVVDTIGPFDEGLTRILYYLR